MNIRSYISSILSVIFIFLTIYILKQFKNQETENSYTTWKIIPLKNKIQNLKRNALYYDKYKRKNIINSLNISELYSNDNIHIGNNKAKNFIRENKILQNHKTTTDKLLQYLWVLNYKPGGMAPAHNGLSNSCLSCHEYLSNDYTKKCLECHIKIKQDLKNKTSYHYKLQEKQCGRCHKEHKGLAYNYVSFKDFNHDDTAYKLKGYHKKADCYYCHRQAANFKPNKILSLNEIARKFMRFQIKGNYSDCTLCHPDVHYPSYGKDCISCHPLNLHWYQ